MRTRGGRGISARARDALDLGGFAMPWLLALLQVVVAAGGIFIFAAASSAPAAQPVDPYIQVRRLYHVKSLQSISQSPPPTQITATLPYKSLPLSKASNRCSQSPAHSQIVLYERDCMIGFN